MIQRQKQLIALISVMFIGQLLFPQYSKADTFNSTVPIKSGLEEVSLSIISVRNSPQPILFDGGVNVDMAQNGSQLAVSNNQTNASVTVSNGSERNDGTDDVAEMKAYVLGEAKRLGLNAREVELIVNCESRWDPKATHKNRNGSLDAGLWQINSIHKNLTMAEKMDYKIATKWALEKRLSDGNWSAWYCARKVGVM